MMKRRLKKCVQYYLAPQVRRGRRCCWSRCRQPWHTNTTGQLSKSGCLKLLVPTQFLEFFFSLREEVRVKDQKKRSLYTVPVITYFSFKFQKQLSFFPSICIPVLNVLFYYLKNINLMYKKSGNLIKDTAVKT